jgi:hypothetical protein
MTDEPTNPTLTPAQQAQQIYYSKVDFVLQDLRKTLLEDRAKTHGDPGLFAHVFAGMLRPYIHGMLTSGRGLQDLDAYNVMCMMKIARQSVSGPVPFYDNSLDAAGYSILRAAHIRPEGLDDPEVRAALAGVHEAQMAYRAAQVAQEGAQEPLPGSEVFPPIKPEHEPGYELSAPVDLDALRAAVEDTPRERLEVHLPPRRPETGTVD